MPIQRIEHDSRMFMNWDQLKDNWKQTKGDIKTKWGKADRRRVACIDGQWDRMVGKLLERYGMTNDEVDREIDS